MNFRSLFLRLTGYQLLHPSKVQPYKNITPPIVFFSNMNDRVKKLLGPYLAFSKSQLGQDLFCIVATQAKRNGFFVEFGATDGITKSNTYLLETEFNYSGILAEPCIQWHEALEKNRSCIIRKEAVFTETGKEVTLISSTSEYSGGSSAELSYLETPSRAKNSSYEQLLRSKNITTYKVPTISLNDLLELHSVPSNFEFLSIDTEGTEFSILNALDFDRWKPQVICVEHGNNLKVASDIDNLLTSQGYKQYFKELSFFDSWYSLNNIDR